VELEVLRVVSVVGAEILVVVKGEGLFKRAVAREGRGD
jgi:hypothetical protein